MSITSLLPIIEVADVREPLLPQRASVHKNELSKENALATQSEIEILCEEAQSERASNAHVRLINLVACRLKAANCTPRCNQLIDLATRYKGEPFIFEAKVITDANAQSQMRTGINQLFEYSYLQGLPRANLVLVTQLKPPQSLAWMMDYLETDRQIHVVWDGNNELFARPDTRQQLAFLWPR
jgi:hypothetical protein